MLSKQFKISSILTNEDGRHRVKLCDFGLSRQLEVDKTTQYLTTGGTIQYMAPELFEEMVI